MLPMNNTLKFSEIWDNADDFKTEFKANPLYKNMADTYINQLFYLLYGTYGNSTIIYYDTNQFKYKFYGIIFQYGPIWVKQLEAQSTLLAMSKENLQIGTSQVFNHANNPSTIPSTTSLDSLTYIDDQNTTNVKKSVMDAYASLFESLDEDVTKRFLDRFKPLFLTIVEPQNEWIYESEEE